MCVNVLERDAMWSNECVTYTGKVSELGNPDRAGSADFAVFR